MGAEQKALEPAMWLPGPFLASHPRTGKRIVMQCPVNSVAELSASNTHAVQFHLQFSRQKGMIRVLNFSFNIRRFLAYVPGDLDKKSWALYNDLPDSIIQHG